MTDTTDLCTPWSLTFDRDGTEDFGIICDAEGDQIVASHICGRDELDKGTFWLPEQPGDLVPLLVRQMKLMTAAPKLLEAIRNTLDDLNCTLDYERQVLLWAAITEATGEEPQLA